MSGRRGLIVVIILLVVIGVAIAAGVAIFWVMRQPVSVAQGSVLEVKMGGGIPEIPSGNPFMELFQPEGLSLWELRQVFDQAAKDNRIAAVYLEVHPLGMSWAQIEEVRDMLKAFRTSGKPIHSFLAVDVVTEQEIYLTSPTTSIYLNPGTGLLVNGLLAEVTFYKNTLDKLHIKPEFIQFKEYKNPGSYSREKMTPEYRGMLEGVIRDIQDRFVQTVVAERKITEDRLHALMATGIVTDKQALENRLIDFRAYKHEVRDKLKFSGDKRKEYKGISAEKYRSAAPDTIGGSSRNRVAYVVAEGTITSGDSEPMADIVGGNTLSTQLRRLRDDNSVKGVILRVNSPGGSVVGSEMVWEEVRMLEKAGKPVIASMSGVAASGGYYISMDARRIVTQPSTITGSIGVIFGKFDLSGFYDWLGMDVEQIKLAPNADIFSFSNSLTDDQKKQLETWMGEVYEVFVSKAAKGRKMSYEQLEPRAHGRIYTGTQALKAGLVDDVGGIETAVARMKEALKLGKNEKLELMLYPRPRTLWESLSSGDLLPVHSFVPKSLRQWIETDASAMSTPAPWVLAPNIRIN